MRSAKILERHGLVTIACEVCRRIGVEGDMTIQPGGIRGPEWVDLTDPNWLAGLDRMAEAILRHRFFTGDESGKAWTQIG